MNFAGVQSITIPEGDVRSVAIGGVTVWEKPPALPYDAEVDYVESTGAQYVDTGVTPDETTAIDLRGVFSAAAGATRFGSRVNITHSQICALSIVSGLLRIDLGTGGSADSQWLATANDCTRIAIDATSRSAAVAESGGTTASHAYASNMTFEGAHPLLVFAFYNGSEPILAGTMRVSSLRIIQGGVLVRDFVPVRGGTVGYLYDRANPTGGPSGNGLYGSATTTPLVAGPDKNGG